jgi:F-type H+-transporting ATPase subunit delta
MAEAITIARPYAQAAFKLASEGGALDAWSRMLELLDRIVTDADMARLIHDPNVGARQLEGALLGICGDQLDGAGRNFVQLLVQYGRLPQLPEIRALYEELKLAHEGVLETEIHTAFPIDQAQIDDLVAKLESKYRRKVRPVISVDPQLIGGVRIVIGDRVLDATVRGRLEAMSAALIR